MIHGHLTCPTIVTCTCGHTCVCSRERDGHRLAISCATHSHPLNACSDCMSGTCVPSPVAHLQAGACSPDSADSFSGSPRTTTGGDSQASEALSLLTRPAWL